MANNETIYLGGGCFWCIETIFNQVKGVEDVISGYMGGDKEDANYKDVCSGNTGHAEVVKVVFNNNIISLSKILDIFFHVHDPTSINRQGNDIGTQYRSVIFYSSELQLKEIENMLLKIKGKMKSEIVTEINSLMDFFQAEDYHVDYYNLHKNKTYCILIISKKINFFKKRFKNYIKD